MGDLSNIVASWPHMEQLFVSGTRAYGSIFFSPWKPYESKLAEIEAAQTNVTIKWRDVQLQEDSHPPFPELMRLVLNDCPLNIDINDFFAPLVMNKQLATIQVSNCGLSGVFTDMRRGWVRINGSWKAKCPRYWRPKQIDLSRNDLIGVEGQPALDLTFINFSDNMNLSDMDNSFLASDLFIDIRGTPINKEILFESSSWKADKDSNPHAGEEFLALIVLMLKAVHRFHFTFLSRILGCFLVIFWS